MRVWTYYTEEDERSVSAWGSFPSNQFVIMSHKRTCTLPTCTHMHYSSSKLKHFKVMLPVLIFFVNSKMENGTMSN